MLKSICLWFRLCSSLTGQAYVLDGDTIAVEGIHVRLHGIDAEELSEPHGAEAKSMLKQIIGFQHVECKLNGDTSYDRYVGTCYVGDIDIGARLIKLGYALDCAHYSHWKYRYLEPPTARIKLIQKPYC